MDFVFFFLNLNSDLYICTYMDMSCNQNDKWHFGKFYRSLNESPGETFSRFKPIREDTKRVLGYNVGKF